MKIAITTNGASLDAQVDPRFGRCPFFLIVDTDTMEVEAVENPNVSLGGGAGIQSGQLMADKDARFVLTGNCGPNAYQTLSAAGIQIIVGCSGPVREVVEQFKAGNLDSTAAPNVASHFGMAGGMGRGMGMGGGGGRGMGRGMGMGGGGGRGMGRGMDMGVGPSDPVSLEPGAQAGPDLSKDEELAMLKQQAAAMSQGLQELSERIKQLQGDTNG